MCVYVCVYVLLTGMPPTANICHVCVYVCVCVCVRMCHEWYVWMYVRSSQLFTGMRRLLISVTYVCMNACVNACILVTYTHVYTRTSHRPPEHRHSNTHLPTFEHKHMHTHVHKHKHKHTSSPCRTSPSMYTYTHKHSSTHTNTHAHTQTQTHLVTLQDITIHMRSTTYDDMLDNECSSPAGAWNMLHTEPESRLNICMYVCMYCAYTYTHRKRHCLGMCELVFICVHIPAVFSCTCIPAFYVMIILVCTCILCHDNLGVFVYILYLRSVS
jgi:hypothetical protein